MATFTDQMGRSVVLTATPKRIVSLVPSQTELLAHWGLDAEVQGITKFCIHPKHWFEQKTRVGGTKKVNIEAVKALNPDLIIGNMEENEQSDMEALMKDFPVWMSNINTLNDCYDMMRSLGQILDKDAAANSLITDLKHRFLSLEAYLPDEKIKPVVAYFIWQEPLMVAAGGTFIDEMLRVAGFQNAFTGQLRYPQISPAELQAACPDFIFLSSEPYPFGQRHLDYFRGLCPQAEAIVVDGELFSWYGSRLLHSVEYFKSLHHSLSL